MLDTRREITGKVSIVGHRGAPDCAPENTMASFREALRQGADIIELDVQLSADGHVVVFHDSRLERTSNGHGLLAERTLAELRTLDAGRWFGPGFNGEVIPTLEDVLMLTKDTIPLLIELKYAASPDLSLGNAVVKLINAHKMTEQVMLISFAHQALRWVRQEAPDLAIAVLYGAGLVDPVGLAQAVGANAVMPLWHTVSKKEVKLCHDAGLSVIVWGAGADYEGLIAMGVDCVSADHPAQVRRDHFRK